MQSTCRILLVTLSTSYNCSQRPAVQLDLAFNFALHQAALCIALVNLQQQTLDLHTAVSLSCCLALARAAVATAGAKEVHRLRRFRTLVQSLAGCGQAHAGKQADSMLKHVLTHSAQAFQATAACLCMCLVIWQTMTDQPSDTFANDHDANDHDLSCSLKDFHQLP